MANIPTLRTLNQFAERHPAWSVPALRFLNFRREDNGFDRAFVRLGRRVLIDEGEFFEVIKRQNRTDVRRSQRRSQTRS